MNLRELKSALQARSELTVTLELPDGSYVPAHYHVTEVGHVVKRFIDCGGTIHASESCVLQTYFGSNRDDGHRLTAGQLAHILDLAQELLASDELPVEVEYEDGVITQFPLAGAGVEGRFLVLQLGLKHTACLAKDRCGISGDMNAEDSGGCCSGPVDGGRCC